MRTLILAAVGFLLVTGAVRDVYSHEAVVVGADNAGGVIAQLCGELTKKAIIIDDIDEADAKAYSDECLAWAVKEMYPLKYEHNHS